MNVLIQQLINGVTVGAVYALVALGFTLVYGVLRIVNFAHGGVYMMGAFIGFTAGKYLGVNLFISILFAMTGAAILGVLIERVAIAPLREADPYSAFLSSLGIGTVLPVLAQKMWGVSTQPYPAHIEFKTFHFGDITINSMQIVIIVAAVLLVLGLQLFVHKTAMGMAMRASSYSVTLSKLMGINVDAVIRATFAISSALAGAGGVLVAAYYDAIFPTMGFVVALKAFTAAVVGGIGSIPGTILGGLLIGILEALAAGFISSSFQDAIAFIILVLMLLFKPTGLMGRDVLQKM